MSNEQKYSVTTPKTTYGIKVNPKKDNQILDEWNAYNLYNRMRSATDNKDFILHDGPPYANGNIHIGHALNKTLKDITNRYQYINGRNINYTPGWDCHGLPIEWKVEEMYRKNGKNKDDDLREFRDDCRKYAQDWIDTQRNEFKSLGIVADWDQPYTTMSYSNESAIVQQLHKFLMADLLVQKNKPIMWSPVEKTALAEAEVEYKDINTKSIYVSSPILNSNLKTDNVHAVVWTTTPWTLPGNQAIAINPEMNYVVLHMTNENKYYLLCDSLVDDFYNNIEYAHLATVIETIKGNDLLGAKVKHPIYDHSVEIISGDFVTDEQGTGLVHIAPGHGMDDFELGIENNLDTTSIIDDNGCYTSAVKVFEGVHVYKANDEIITYLTNIGNLIHVFEIIHSYPHSWRSKKPVIYKTTPQWFIDVGRFKQHSLDAIDTVRWFPEHGRNRLYSMLENRNEWCISRQRAWGVPIMIFVDCQTGNLLKDYKTNEKIVSEVKKHGCDIWFEQPNTYFIDDPDVARRCVKVTDILDVWFDSGCTNAFVLNNQRADLYFEGSDQHRGWFQSSLLVSTALGGIAPYRDVVTHGFVMAGKNQKMSKSDKNGITPIKVTQQYGTDVLRMWAGMSDYTTDLTINDGILKQIDEQTRKIRNTIRFCLGNLQDTESPNAIDYSKLPYLEKYMVNRMVQLKSLIIGHIEQYQYSKIMNLLIEFCNELSSLYFDVRKDSLYCDGKDSIKRQSTLYVLSLVFDFLTLFMSPIMPFSVYEAIKCRGKDIDYFCTRTIDNLGLPITHCDESLMEKWVYYKLLRSKVMQKLEELRSNSVVKSGLETEVILHMDPNNYANVEENDMSLCDLFIVSKVKLVKNTNGEPMYVEVNKYNGKKCPRCWVYHEEDTVLCSRCDNVEDD